MKKKNKKDAIIKWCPKKEEQDSGAGEGVRTAAQKTLRPGSMDGETSNLNIAESSLHRYFYKRRLQWFYRIDESGLALAMQLALGSRRAAAKSIKDPALQHLSRKERAKIGYNGYKQKVKDTLINRQRGSLLPSKSEREGKPFFKFWESASHDDLFSEFTEFATQYLNLRNPPDITYVEQMEGRDTFACWSGDGITLAYKNRHPMDVFRSLAHELVHHKQHEMDVLHSESGKTGSEHENEANAVAGIIMRDFAKIRPEYFSLDSLSEARKVGLKLPRQPKGIRSHRSSSSSSRRTPKIKLSSFLKFGKKKKTAAKKPVVPKEKAVPKEKPATKKQEPHTDVKQEPSSSKKIDTGLQQTIEKKIDLLNRLRSVHSKTLKNATITTKDGMVMNRKKFYQQSIDHHQNELNRIAAENGITINKNDFQKPTKPKTLQASPYAVKPPASAGKRGEKGEFTTFHGVSNKKPSGSGRHVTPKKPPVVAEKIGFRETLALMKKSERSDIPLEVLKEVFNRGFRSRDYPHLTREQAAFNRVNSFIAGGAAREVDNDLLEEDNG